MPDAAGDSVVSRTFGFIEGMTGGFMALLLFFVGLWGGSYF